MVTGQSILREALQIADHNAYHTAEIILLRLRMLGGCSKVKQVLALILILLQNLTIAG
jgi:hypothetical protein